MKLGEAISRVQSLYSRGVRSDDSRLYPGHIYSKLLGVRAILIFQKISKKQRISRFNYQTLGCIKMEKVSPGDCPCLPAIGCKILRTPFRLPSPILSMDGDMIQSVSSVEGSIEFSLSTWEEQKYKKGRKYTKYKPEYFLRDNFLYINVSKGMPGYISVTGLFRDPIEASAYPNSCDECPECDECESFFDLEFPIDNDLEEPLIQIASQELVDKFLQIPSDNLNNSTDDKSMASGQQKEN